jgi:hypothetical protein
MVEGQDHKIQVLHHITITTVVLVVELAHLVVMVSQDLVLVALELRPLFLELRQHTLVAVVAVVGQVFHLFMVLVALVVVVLDLQVLLQLQVMEQQTLVVEAVAAEVSVQDRQVALLAVMVVQEL